MLNVQKDGRLTNLAYITAATYGLEAEAEQIAPTMKTGPPPIDPDSKFFRPPAPVQQAESNWPLLTVSRVSKTRLIGGVPLEKMGTASTKECRIVLFFLYYYLIFTTLE